VAQSNPAVPDGQSPVQRSRTQTGPAKAHNVFDHRVSVLRSIGEAGEHKHRRVRIVSQSRPLFGSYYALRTTHDVVIAQLNPLLQGNYLARRHLDQRLVLHFSLRRANHSERPVNQAWLFVRSPVGIRGEVNSEGGRYLLGHGYSQANHPPLFACLSGQSELMILENSPITSAPAHPSLGKNA
jgi:hypothetical protein